MTSNMGLTESSPLVTSGPAWAQGIEDNWLLVDAHDHSSGKGVRITPAGISIDSTLDFLSQDADNLRSSQYDSQGAAFDASELRRVYVVGGELYYNDGTGVAVQITAGGAVNVAGVGGITGLAGTTAAVTYSDITKIFSFTQDAGIAAHIAGADLTIREAVAAANGVTIKSPTGLAGNYNLTLPAALPGTTQALTVSAAGVMAFGPLDGSQLVSNIALSGAVTVATSLTTPIVDATNYITAANYIRVTAANGEVQADRIRLNNGATGPYIYHDVGGNDGININQSGGGNGVFFPAVDRTEIGIGADGDQDWGLFIWDETAQTRRPIIVGAEGENRSPFILYARVTSTGSVSSSGGNISVSHPSAGRYDITVSPQSDSTIKMFATLADTGTSLCVFTSNMNATGGRVIVRTPGGTLTDSTFDLIVFGTRGSTG